MTDVAPDAVPWDALMAAQEPVIMRGLACGWGLARAGYASMDEAMGHLARFYRDAPVTAFRGSPEIRGRFFYDEARTGLNFDTGRVRLTDLMRAIARHADDPEPPAFYTGATSVGETLPGFRAENDLVLNHPMFSEQPPQVGIWLGNRTTAAAHFDASHNLACNLVGRRRFTLFPADQVGNLYPGPMAPTPGGQIVSMVDMAAPDLAAHPRYAEAARAGQVAELEPGDVLFYPAMWWHRVEAREAFNVMVNYWWNTAPAHLDTPMTTLLHAMLSLRERPAPEKEAWRAILDYYVFGEPDAPRAHLPEAACGPLGEMDERAAQRLKAIVVDCLKTEGTRR